MKLLLENENIEKLLLSAGYIYYGQSRTSFKKYVNSSYFHAIIDYNYPMIELHLDVPRSTPNAKGLRHDTIHKSRQLSKESKRIYSMTLDGKLEKVLINIEKYEKSTRDIQPDPRIEEGTENA